jgi:hypothetical protein
VGGIDQPALSGIADNLVACAAAARAICRAEQEEQQ